MHCILQGSLFKLLLGLKSVCVCVCVCVCMGVCMFVCACTYTYAYECCKNAVFDYNYSRLQHILGSTMDSKGNNDIT